MSLDDLNPPKPVFGFAVLNGSQFFVESPRDWTDASVAYDVIMSPEPEYAYRTDHTGSARSKYLLDTAAISALEDLVDRHHPFLHFVAEVPREGYSGISRDARED